MMLLACLVHLSRRVLDHVGGLDIFGLCFVGMFWVLISALLVYIICFGVFSSDSYPFCFIPTGPAASLSQLSGELLLSILCI
jgi:hypothetical protein